MTTPAEIIAQALKLSGVLGVGQTASAEDTNDSFFMLNAMLSQWARKRWLIYTTIDVSCVFNGGQSYTVGTGQQINTPRPDRVEYAYYRQFVSSTPNIVDYGLELISSREDYSKITLKNLNSTLPAYLYYDPSYPVGRAYPWPLANPPSELHLVLKFPLSAFTSLAQDVNLPAEYTAALFWSLAVRLRPMYQLAPDATVTAMADESLNVLRGANAQVSRLQLPGTLVRNSAHYNIFGDVSS